MFSSNKYMDFEDVKLKTPLSSLKLAEKGNDTLIVPDTVVPEVVRFLYRDDIKYQIIENTTSCPPEVVKADMQRYIELDGSFVEDDPVLLITPYDKDALFAWTLQTFGETMDPSYRAYLDSERRRGEDYYNHQYEFRP